MEIMHLPISTEDRQTFFHMKTLLVVLLPVIAMSLSGCQTTSTPEEDVALVDAASPITPMAISTVSVDPGAGTATVVVPVNTQYIIEWRMSTGWSQRITVTSNIAGVLEKQVGEPKANALVWRHPHNTGAVPETLTVLFEHKDDLGNWDPSTIRTRALRTTHKVRFVIDAQDHQNDPKPVWNNSQLVFRW
jgi:predicted small secreted protein